MGLSIYMFAGPTDYRELSDFLRSIELKSYPILVNQRVDEDDPAAYPFAYLSPLNANELHPYGEPAGIGSATDPLLEFMKPYYKDNALVVGRLYCSADAPHLFAITKPLFARIRTWIRFHWSKLPSGQYIGPEAAKLTELGVQLKYFPPMHNYVEC